MYASFMNWGAAAHVRDRAVRLFLTRRSVRAIVDEALELTQAQAFGTPLAPGTGIRRQ
jgi:hypothetical protein